MLRPTLSSTSGVGTPEPASAGKAKAGVVHSIRGQTRGWQVNR